MRNGLQVGLCIGKTDNNFSEKGIDFCPATLVTVRKGLHIVKTEFNLAKKKFHFRPATLATERKGLREKTLFYYM